LFSSRVFFFYLFLVFNVSFPFLLFPSFSFHWSSQLLNPLLRLVDQWKDKERDERNETQEINNETNDKPLDPNDLWRDASFLSTGVSTTKGRSLGSSGSFVKEIVINLSFVYFCFLFLFINLNVLFSWLIKYLFYLKDLIFNVGSPRE